MNAWAKKHTSSAIISVGDNFYAGNTKYEGAATSNDPKFKTFWKNVYTGDAVRKLPWWNVLGNHDWETVGSYANEIKYKDPLWMLPDFFYAKRVVVSAGVYATFVFIETDYLVYGEQGENAAMASNFKRQGWSSKAETNKKQLAWIENTISKANNDAYIIVVGHHPTYSCAKDVSSDMKDLLDIINKWNVNLYVNGHSHNMAGYLTRGGKTLHVQAGSGGQTSKLCDPLDKSYKEGHASKTLGFAHLSLSKNGGLVDWVSEKGDVVFSMEVGPRTPVKTFADVEYLTSASDPAVHIVE
ncbi:Metallo-dependent phosphatase [Rhizoclosmatium globosum]|uniref:Metallo-dependent phosphatase n=1 Tax=Rhizoclosmatium globosum TaxID=329046 RepID=A0A1Y2CJ36_9FUNG|nr:Metallo-dependent phosphatase [Rhizoclosmatium globosum]|eukprot:ORY47058.1 Metallo-dependent phosphatase [Rhizoclosmatium globosum]